jgi:hypothetical protein
LPPLHRRPPNGEEQEGFQFGFVCFQGFAGRKSFPPSDCVARPRIEGAHSGDRARRAMSNPSAMVGRAPSAICDRDRSARWRRARRRRSFGESMATADSRHRRSNEENSMTPDSQKQKLAYFEGRTANVFSIMRESSSTVFHAGSGNGLNRSARRDEVESFKAWS